ncbi:hypothetical protein FRC01_009730 [Tulasnella sp. 417]|nr:hypothetical protein FRC01_009730 [Tulasnella sp. 417]
MLFRTDWSAKHKHQTIGNTSVNAAIEWRNLPAAERAVWHRRAELVKAEHKRMYPGYKYRPSQNKGNPGKSSPSTARAKSSARTRTPSQLATASAAVPDSPAKLEGPAKTRRARAGRGEPKYSLSDLFPSEPRPSKQPSQAANPGDFNVPMSIPPLPGLDSVYEPPLLALPPIVAAPKRFAAPTPTYSVVIPEVPASSITPSRYGADGSVSYGSLLPPDVYQGREPRSSATYTLPTQPLSLGNPPHYSSDRPTAHSKPYSASTLQVEGAGPSRNYIIKKRSFPAPYHPMTYNGGSQSAPVGPQEAPRQYHRLGYPWENRSGFAWSQEVQPPNGVSGHIGLPGPISIDPTTPRTFGGYLHVPTISIPQGVQQPSPRLYVPHMPEQQSTLFNQHPWYNPGGGHLLQPRVPYPVDVGSSPSSSSSASFGPGSLPTASSFESSSPSHPPLPSSQLNTDASLQNAGVDLQAMTLNNPTYSTTESHGPNILITTAQPMDAALASVDDGFEDANRFVEWADLYAPSEPTKSANGAPEL